MKKLVSILISVVMVLALMSIPASADDYATVTVVDAAANVGEDVTVTVNVEANGKCNGASFYLAYDNTLLTYKSLEIKAAFTDDDLFYGEDTPGVITVVVVPGSPLQLSGAFIDFTFTAIAAGSASIVTSEEPNGFLDADYLVADASYGSGTVTITEAQADPVIAVTAAIDGNGYVGEALTANVVVTSDGEAVATPALTYSWTIDGAVVSASATYTPDAADNGKTVKLVATYNGVASNEAEKAITKNPADEPTDKPLVSASKKTVVITNNEDKNVDVTVDLAGSTGFAALGIEVAYDDDYITLTNVTPTDIEGVTFTGPEPVEGSTASYNPHLFTWYTTAGGDVVYNGTLATLTFTVDGDAPADAVYAITVTYYKGLDGNAAEGEYNYAVAGDIAMDYSNGSITISKAYNYTGDIDANGAINDADAILLMKYLAKWNVTVDEDALDTNGDARVNAKDVTHLLRYLNKWEGIQLSFRG